MTITKVTLSKMLLLCSEMFLLEANYFSEIDSRFGDGDHGVAMKNIAKVIRSSLECWDCQSLKQFIDGLGAAIMGLGGGSTGPLWGTLISGLALPLQEDTAEIDATLLKAMLASSLEEMKSITAARVGDKTMMDTLIPAVQAAQTAGNQVSEVLEAAAMAAEQGAKDTEKYVSKFGRAKNYKEQTIGTPDAGAVSLNVFFQGLALGVK